ncbi:MAG: RlpA-like double-psi beta-barrel domain-containing protein [Candidatus Limnocylindrales bacterium]
MADIAAIADFAPRARSSSDARVAFGQPEAAAADADVKSVVKLPPTRLRARGDATWYCLSGVSACHRDFGGGMYAAAGAELRVGDWRGRTVTVCAGDDCIRVKLVDWCACPGDRVIDLYGDAFRRLSSLRTGILPVSVRW